LRLPSVFWYRAQPVPPFTVEWEADRVVITTEHVRLTYHVTAKGFVRESLSIEVKATSQTWKYGDRGGRQNLRGTARTLDGVNGALYLERGLLSRAGWAVWTMLAVWSSAIDMGWARSDSHAIDLYFFGYG
jgi:hypothetical protein